MKNSGSSVLDSRIEGSGLVLVVTGFLVTEGFSEESGLRRGSRDEEIPAAKSRQEKCFECARQNMLVYGGGRA